MEELNANEIGLRCKRIRMAHNISQQELADRCNTTAQNISKFEKKGISDIYWITTISNALGQSLLVSEADSEGEVGKVGNEILRILIKRTGYFRTANIMNHKLYGLSDEQITHEIVKLERIGMVVREQFVNFDENELDVLFITAKGLITIKNRSENSDLRELIKKVRTYEMIIDEYGDYQDFIDNNPAEKLIRAINYRRNNKNQFSLNSAYRANYISYLKGNFEKGLCNDISGNKNIKFLLTNRNCYYDIMYRMAMKLDNDKLWKYVFAIGDELNENVDICLDEEKGTFDVVTSEAEKNFEIDMPWIVETEGYINDIQGNEHEINEKEEQNGDNIDEEFLYSFAPRQIYEMNRPQNKSVYPIYWFTKEEIEQFIIDNFKPASTEEEKEVEKALRKINRLIPETLEYYAFPNEWERNGLADLVRNIYKISK